MTKKKLKPFGLQTKVIVLLSFILVVLMLFLFNRMGVLGFMPNDIMEEPWPLAQSCQAPLPKTDHPALEDRAVGK